MIVVTLKDGMQIGLLECTLGKDGFLRWSDPRSRKIALKDIKTIEYSKHN